MRRTRKGARLTFISEASTRQAQRQKRDLNLKKIYFKGYYIVKKEFICLDEHTRVCSDKLLLKNNNNKESGKI